ncbi:hypothetical protein OCU04_009992 [Sclerotinia nivalis]|uniref:Uncharacterized protein n=1 Tax=Sclerotinia nivalis TaxID=352851 RepID=A0A9X0ADL5_9HELO|nr:hypothetical protein OCU04_009992 [Sclerotinia nivalis]
MISDACDTTLEDERNLDWALIAVSDRTYSDLPNLCKYEYLAGIWDGTFDSPEVFVILLSARGPLMGSMSRSFSYIIQPPGKVLIRIHLLTFNLPDCEGREPYPK